MMRIYLTLYILLFYMTGFSQCPDQTSENYDYCLKEISIEGTTNLNSFSFWYKNPVLSDITIEEEDCHPEPEAGIMDFTIPVQSFRGSIPAMRNDFLDLLRASEYPEIIVGIEKSAFDCIAAGIHNDRIDLIVTLAGTQKAIHASYSASFESGNMMILRGITRFLLTDFLLEPPEKVLGLVRVQNEVFIKFDIVISNSQMIANKSIN